MSEIVGISESGSAGSRGGLIVMKRIAAFAVVAVLAMSIAAPAFATGADGAGSQFGPHHAAMALEMGGFTGTMNPGVMHQGFSGWKGM